MWKIYGLLAAFFAALTAIFAKLGVREIDSNLAVALRTGFILVLTWGTVFRTGAIGEIRALSSRGLLFIFLSAIATGLSWLFYFKALQLGEASKVASLDKLSLAFTILLAILLLGEPVGFKTVMSGLLITGGSLLLLF
ncbi:MAG: EamA family transporter [Planctomycetota bacterium]|jgi:transporter family protein|nr:EamA family transporter [Planctomycetota bacterium]